MADKFQGYRGSDLIKKAGVRTEWTAELLEEFAKCADPVTGPHYFIANYVKIIHVDHGLVNFVPYEYQTKAIDLIHNNRNTILAWARQSGKSVTFCGYVLWYIIFNSAKTVGILANKQETSVELLDRIQIAYSYLPPWLQVGVKKFNAKSFVLENDSRVLAGSTGSGTIRGKSLSMLILDETAFIQGWDKFAASTLPTLASGKETKLVMVSTPNGLNHFWKTWDLAVRGENDYKPLMVKWYDVPGRDESWKQQALASMNFDTVQFDQEYGVEFQGSSGTLIAGWKLKELHHQIPIYKGNNGLNQYEKPIAGSQYVLVADCGEGVGLDKSAFSVFDTTKMPYRQVCTFTNNLIPPTDYAHYIHYIAKMYNNAFALIETNAIGSLVQNILHEQLEYENVFFTQNAGPSGKKVSAGFGDKTIEGGIKTTKKVKQIGCSIIKLMIEQNQLILNDFDTIYELSRFSRKGTSYEAEDGTHDDLVMTLVLFAWLTDQAYFKEIMSIDTVLRLRAQSQQQIIDEVTPFGFIDYGVSEVQQHTDLQDNHDKYNPYTLNDDQIALLR